ncbi:EF-hand calcium-binding domain-containing protein 5 [Platysternon megacephalum]|uniref:EF-hand calcium-binding domain-containing protein 5 n=1 Tax=Platysternon megacephalum TaxID=55544 RepID=A0A4D9DT41_9SAUR|nr:EF-hand calcium-binding domain-containing protein 5 [Platysternon megacephalum]
MVAVVCIGSICMCCCKKGYRKKITVDEAEIKNLLVQKAHDYILKQKEEAIWQRLNDEYLADPETILVSIDNKKISGIIDRVCNISREGSADQEGEEMVSASPQGTSSLLPQETSSLLPQETSSLLPQEISEISSCPREGSADQEGEEMVSASPQGTSSLLPQEISEISSCPREGSADQGGIEMVSASPQGTSSLLPQGTSSLSL